MIDLKSFVPNAHERSQYAAPNLYFAGEVQFFAATFAQVQRKAEILSGFAATITSMRIAENKM